jgi:hypothetical protein
MQVVKAQVRVRQVRASARDCTWRGAIVVEGRPAHGNMPPLRSSSLPLSLPLVICPVSRSDQASQHPVKRQLLRSLTYQQRSVAVRRPEVCGSRASIRRGELNSCAIS